MNVRSTARRVTTSAAYSSFGQSPHFFQTLGIFVDMAEFVDDDFFVDHSHISPSDPVDELPPFLLSLTRGVTVRRLDPFQGGFGRGRHRTVGRPN